MRKKSAVQRFFSQPGPAAAGSERKQEPRSVSQPPKSTPHSDLHGVHRDEKPNVESAVEAGEGTQNLALARDEAAAKPDYSDDVKNRDDRSR
jgi:hypothetical protein